uniref:Uncharacterized protein n=1 Tax=viral metagenome TaxID=1070528 RepID=A0A6C0H3F8_9ZZZZ
MRSFTNTDFCVRSTSSRNFEVPVVAPKELVDNSKNNNESISDLINPLLKSVEQLTLIVKTQLQEIDRLKKIAPNVEEPNVEEPKVEEPKVEEPKVEEPKVEEPKVEEPKVEEPKVEEPKVEEPKVVRRKYHLDILPYHLRHTKVHTPVVETPVVETPVVETPVVETPVVYTVNTPYHILFP